MLKSIQRINIVNIIKDNVSNGFTNTNNIAGDS